MVKIAILITGDVRNCNAKNILIEQFRNFDVYCASYIKHKTYIEKIGKNNKNILINPNNEISFPYGLNEKNMQQNMLQWMHLNNLIKKYKNELLNYDIIFKFRFDCLINSNDYENLIKNLIVKHGILYNKTDQVFFSDSKTFIKLFENFYDNISFSYIHKDNNIEDCFEKSWKSEYELYKYTELMGIKYENNINFKVVIDRGKYKKVSKDGNKKLYNNSILQGKFS
jgi:hypothetical protein